ncbi:MAG TPA: hypothetical protein VJT74_08095 [Pyrinomonadaceae bacterium]|nr:hypothetical protein [Pyrinomonadaceae bacterium]
MKKRPGRRHGVVTLLILLTLAASGAPRPPARDFLTPMEEERVKEAQILDKRIEVFIKAAERRLLVLTGPTAADGKQLKKDSELWGELPTGTRTELIMDIANILDAAVTNIDDVALRDEKNSLIPKALRKLAAEATRLQSQVAALGRQTEVTSERRAVEHVMTNIQEILEAAGRLPAEEPGKKEKGKSKKDGQ